MGLGLALLLIAGATAVSYSHKGTASKISDKGSLIQASSKLNQANVKESVGKLPLAFEPNQGQVNPQVKYMARAKGYTAILTENETILAYKGSQIGMLHMKVQNAQPARMVASDLQAGKSNYLGKHVTNVANYGKVTYKGIYQGIDLAYSGNQHNLEYDFIVNPGADPSQIRVAYNGSSRFELDAQGNLQLETAAGPTVSQKPYVYQTVHGARKQIAGEYVLTASNEVGFKLGEYDHSKALVIDPVLMNFATNGGSGNDEDFGINVNTTGTVTGVYITGRTASTDYLVQSALQSTHSALPAGNFDVFITKLDATGTNLVYSTYLGAAGDDAGQGIVADNLGNAYVGGYTSLNMAGSPTPVVAFTGSYAAFVVKIAPNGQSIAAITYLNGNGTTQAFGIAMDSPATANLAIAGLTNGIPGKTFNGGTSDAFVAKFDTNLNLTASADFGGSNYDQANAVAMDAAGNVYVAGLTASGNTTGAGIVTFPTTTISAGVPNINVGSVPFGQQTAFATKFTSNLGTRTWSSIWGAGGEDATGIAVDPTGASYITGTTNKVAFYPASNPTACASNPSLGGSLPTGSLTFGVPIAGTCTAGVLGDPAAGRSTQGFLVALNNATPGTALTTDGTLRYVALQPASGAIFVTPIGGCNLNLLRTGGALGGVPNPCVGTFNSWNAAAADGDQEAYVTGQLSAAGPRLTADFIRFSKAGAVATNNTGGGEIIIDAGAGNGNFAAYAVTVTGFREAFIAGDTNTAVALAAGLVTPGAVSAAFTTPGIVGTNATPPPATCVIGNTVVPCSSANYPKSGGGTLTTTGFNGGAANSQVPFPSDGFIAGFQFTDLVLSPASPNPVNLGNVAVNSGTGASGPTVTIALQNQFGIATPCSAPPTITNVAPTPGVPAVFTVTQVAGTATYQVQLAAGATGSPGFLNANATFVCAGAENTITVQLNAVVTGSINIATSNTLSATEAFNSGIFLPYNTSGVPGNSSVIVSVTTAAGTIPVTATITNKSGNFPNAACNLFAIDPVSPAGSNPGLPPSVPTGGAGPGTGTTQAGTAGTVAAPFQFDITFNSACALSPLQPATYTASLSVAPTISGTGTATVTTPITLVVGPGSIVNQAPPTLVFGASTIPQQAAFTIVANNGALTYGINYCTAASTPGAVSSSLCVGGAPLGNPSPFGSPLPGANVTIVSGGSGTIPATGSQSVVFQVNPVGLAKGVYSGTFQVVTGTFPNQTSIQNITATVFVGTGLGVIKPTGGSLVVNVPTGFVAANIAQPFAVGAVSGTTTLGAVAAVPPTFAITGLDNSNGVTPYSITPTVTLTPTPPSGAVTIVPTGACSTSATGAVCGYNLTIDTTTVTTATQFTGNVTFTASAATGGASVVVPLTINATQFPGLNVSLTPGGPQVTQLTYRGVAGSVPASPTANCTILYVNATGGTVPGVSSSLPSSAPYLSMWTAAAAPTALANPNLTIGSVTSAFPPLAPTGNPAVFQVCANQSLTPQPTGTFNSTLTVTGSGVGSTVTIPTQFIVTPPATSAGPGEFQQIGIFRAPAGGLGTFGLDVNENYNFDNGIDKFRQFGLSGDIPVAGDFFGTGVVEIGVFRCPAPGAGVCQFYIDANNNGQWDGIFAGDVIWNFGLPGDQPIIGDWGGTPFVSKIGVMRCPTPVGQCTWYLATANGNYSAATTIVETYGLTGDIPVANNWLHTGTSDQIGVFRCPASGVCTWFVNGSGSGMCTVVNNACSGDQQYTYGLPGDKPIVGNWFGTGSKRIGVFRGGQVILNLSGSNVFVLGVDFTGNFGLPGDLPVVGFWTMP
jgi:hypothetical protein